MLAPVLFAAGVLANAASPFPAIEGQTLADQKIAIPSAMAAHPAILCIGFSHASSKAVSAWADQSRKRFAQNGIAVFVVVELQDAPRFVRPMAIHGMKSGTPEDQRSHFIVLTSGEDELKRTVHFDDSAQPYVVLLDSSGNVVWQHTGAVSVDAQGELDRAVKSLSESK